MHSGAFSVLVDDKNKECYYYGSFQEPECIALPDKKEEIFVISVTPVNPCAGDDYQEHLYQWVRYLAIEQEEALREGSVLLADAAFALAASLGLDSLKGKVPFVRALAITPRATYLRLRPEMDGVYGSLHVEVAKVREEVAQAWIASAIKAGECAGYAPFSFPIPSCDQFEDRRLRRAGERLRLWNGRYVKEAARALFDVNHFDSVVRALGV